MGPSTCSLGACSVLGIFGGAHAWVLKSEQMLGSLVLRLDTRRVLGEHQRITECGKKTEKIGSSNFTVDIRFTKKISREKIKQQNF